MPLYINEDDPIFTSILEYRRAKEDLLLAAARGDTVPLEAASAYRSAAVALAEAVDKDARR